jgi:hypothetical protein
MHVTKCDRIRKLLAKLVVEPADKSFSVFLNGIASRSGGVEVAAENLRTGTLQRVSPSPIAENNIKCIWSFD